MEVTGVTEPVKHMQCGRAQAMIPGMVLLEHLCKDQVCPRHQHMQEQRMRENVAIGRDPVR